MSYEIINNKQNLRLTDTYQTGALYPKFCPLAYTLIVKVTHPVAPLKEEVSTLPVLV